MITLVPTPIGNLKDVSERALETLKSVDLVLCEDTRTTQKLFHLLGIEKKLKSYHAHNEKEMLAYVEKALEEGLHIALVSDAGMPAIQDPGEVLIHHLYKKGFKVGALPGPSAPILALILSGLPTTPFQFLGFFPRTSKEEKKLFPLLTSYPGTSIFFESPKRVLKALKKIHSLFPEREVALLKELTKMHEQRFFGSAESVKNALEKHFEGREPKGEYVLLVGPENTPPPLSAEEVNWDDVYKEVERARAEGLSLREASKKAAEKFHLISKIVYNKYIQ